MAPWKLNCSLHACFRNLSRSSRGFWMRVTRVSFCFVPACLSRVQSPHLTFVFRERVLITQVTATLGSLTSYSSRKPAGLLSDLEPGTFQPWIPVPGWSVFRLPFCQHFRFLHLFSGTQLYQLSAISHSSKAKLHSFDHCSCFTLLSF